jgi:hypothetical protein
MVPINIKRGKSGDFQNRGGRKILQDELSKTPNTNAKKK